MAWNEEFNLILPVCVQLVSRKRAGLYLQQCWFIVHCAIKPDLR
jgi:hypothetical protein